MWPTPVPVWLLALRTVEYPRGATCPPLPQTLLPDLVAPRFSAAIPWPAVSKGCPNAVAAGPTVLNSLAGAVCPSLVEQAAGREAVAAEPAVLGSLAIPWAAFPCLAEQAVGSGSVPDDCRKMLGW